MVVILEGGLGFSDLVGRMGPPAPGMEDCFV